VLTLSLVPMLVAVPVNESGVATDGGLGAPEMGDRRSDALDVIVAVVLR